MSNDLNDFSDFDAFMETGTMPAQPETDDSWQVTKGFKAGIDQTQAIGGGLVAALGDAFDSDTIRQYGLDVYERNMEEALENAGRVAGFTEIGKDGNYLGDFADWAFYTAGNMAPMLATSLAGGGLGGALAHRAANSVAKSAAQKVIAKRMGQAAGAYATSAGLETGSIYGEIKDSDYDSKASTAFAHGAVSGALDALPVKRLLDRMGVGELAGDAITDSVVKFAGKQMVAEGATEGLQSVIEQHAKYWVDENAKEFNIDPDQVINSMAAGALMGGVAGAGISSISKPRPAEEMEKAREEAKEQGGDALDQAMAGSEALNKAASERAPSGFGESPEVERAIKAAQKERMAKLRAKQQKLDPEYFVRGQPSDPAQTYDFESPEITAPEERPAFRENGSEIEFEAPEKGDRLSLQEDYQYEGGVDFAPQESETNSLARSVEKQVEANNFRDRSISKQEALPAPDAIPMPGKVAGNKNTGMDQQASMSSRSDSDPSEVRSQSIERVRKVLGGERFMANKVSDVKKERIKEERQSRLPMGLNDERWLREESASRPAYKEAVLDLSKELVKGGNVGYVRDANDQIVSRTPSQNPSWAQEIMAEEKVSTAYIKATVAKAYKGKSKLTEKQSRIVSKMLDQIEGEYEDDLNIQYAQEQRQQATVARRARKDDRARKEVFDTAQQGLKDSDYSYIDNVEFDEPQTLSQDERVEADALVEAMIMGVPDAIIDEIALRTDDSASFATEVRKQARRVITNERQGNLNAESEKATEPKQGEAGRPSEVSENDTVDNGERGRVGERSEADPEEAANRTDGQRELESEEPLLTSYTDKDLQEREAKQAEAARKEKEQEAKAEADAKADDFQLTGSERQADANPNQQDLLDQPNTKETSSTSTAEPEWSRRIDSRIELSSMQQEAGIKTTTGNPKPWSELTDAERKQFNEKWKPKPDDLYIEDVKGKSFAIKGETVKYKNQLRALGGKWNDKDRTWVFDESELSAVKEELGDFIQSSDSQSNEKLAPQKAEKKSTSKQEALKDSGVELFANRRGQKTITLADLDDMNETEQVKAATKAKIWPKPNYEKLVEDGLNPLAAYALKTVYDALGTKPPRGSDEYVRAYVDTMNKIRDVVQKHVVSDEFKQDIFKALEAVSKTSSDYMAQMRAMRTVSESMGKVNRKIEEEVFPKNEDGKRWGAKNRDGNLKVLAVGGNRFLKRSEVDSTALQKAVKDISEGWPAKRESWMKSYDVSERDGKWVLTRKRSRTAIRTLDTREEAVEAARTIAKVVRKVKFKEPSVPVRDADREGKQYREGDVDSDTLREQFGFRGINYGNWMNPADRQLHTNHAYDAFMDLSELLGVPPKALSLNGQLGIAFGAQGSGGKTAAHFVAGVNEINITKTMGAGSLAHEWGHALDHNFGVIAGLAREDDPFFSEYADKQWKIKDSDVRPEIVEAYKKLLNAMEEVTEIRTPEQMEKMRSDSLEKAKKDVTRYIDRIRSRMRVKDGDSNLDAFEAIAGKLEKGERGEMVRLGKTQNYIGSNANELRNTVRKITGYAPDKDLFAWLDNSVGAMEYAKDAESFAKIHKPQITKRSDFKGNATYLDGDTKKKYFSTRLEMFARSFEMYVLDRLGDSGFKNDYLTAAWKNLDPEESKKIGSEAHLRYPQGDERNAINEAFDGLIGALEVSESEQGPGLMSRSKTSSDSKADHISVDQLRSVADEFKAYYNDNIPIDITVVEKQEDAFGQEYSVENSGYQIAGDYRGASKAAVLVANSIRDEKAARKILRHELLGHYGLNTFNPKDKVTLLQRVVDSKQSIGLRKTWNKIEKDYGDKSQLEQAEEVFASIVEQGDSIMKRLVDMVAAPLSKILRKAGLVKGAISRSELREVMRKIASGIRNGTATQQNFPKNDYSLFSRTSVLSESEAEALEKLGLAKKQSQTLTEKISELSNKNWKEVWEGFKTRSYEGLFDGLSGLRNAEKAAGVTNAEESGYVGARLATGVADTMTAILNYGAPEWREGVLQYKEGTRGLLEMFGDLGDNLNDWLAWMGGMRAQELMDQGRENNLTQSDINALKAKNSGNEELFEQVRKDYIALNRAMLDMSEKAGLIESGTRQKWESDYYIPFYRQSGEDGNADTVLLAPRTKQGLSHQSAGIKALKGGEIPTNDLLENILTNWIKLTDSAMKNSALLKTVNNLKDTEYLTDESMRYQQQAIPKSELNKRMRNDRKYKEMVADFLGEGRDADVDKLINKVAKLDNEGYELMWAITAPTDPDIIRVTRNGKNEYYRVNDPALLRSVTHLNAVGSQDPITKTGRYFKRLLTTGVTASPDFILRNFIRDAAHAWAINPDGFKFGKDSFKGLRDAIKEDEDYRALMFSGASFQGGYVHGTDPDASAQLVRRALEKKGLSTSEANAYASSLLNTPSKLKGAVEQGWQKYRTLGDKIENANRLATFKAALEAGKPMAQAVFESKDLMDYSLRGNFAALQWFTDVIPFLNARMQGLSKLGRAAAENPRKVFMQTGMKIAAFSFALAALNDDEERYQQLPDWDKDSNWHFFLGDDHYRIPKPFEIGIIFGTMPERIYHTMADNQPNEKLLWSLQHNLFHTLNVNPTPQFVMPIAEVVANRSFFFDTPIEGMSDDGKLTEARYSERTSSTMKELGALGKWIGLSPKELEHLWNGYLGTIGMYALGAADIATNHITGRAEQPKISIEDMPVFRSFYKGDGPAKSTQYMTDVFDRMTEVEQIYRTIRSYRKEGLNEEADALFTSEKEKLRYRRALGKARKSLGTINRQMDQINRSKMLTAKQKREKLEQLRQRKNEIAQRFAELTDEAF